MVSSMLTYVRKTVRQRYTPGAVSVLPWVGFEPTTHCILSRAVLSTHFTDLSGHALCVRVHVCSHEEEIEQIVTCAQKELQLETEFRAIEEYWNEQVSIIIGISKLISAERLISSPTPSLR